MIDREEVADLIKNCGECEYLDFKLMQYNKNNKHEFIKDIMAFANAHNQDNKYIIIGIKKRNDKIDFQSIDDITDDAEYQQIINDYIEPQVKFQYLPFEYKKNKLAMLVIDKTNFNNRPFSIKKEVINIVTQKIFSKKGDMFIRRGSSTSNITRFDLDKIYKTDEKTSQLIIRGFYNNDILEDAVCYDFEYNKLLFKLKERVVQKTAETNSIQINKVINIEEENQSIVSALSVLGSSIFKETYIGDITVEDKEKKIIQQYCDKNNIQMSSDFFDFGSLKKYSKLNYSSGILPYTEEFYKGTDNEKLKYKNIKNILDNIKTILSVENQINTIKNIKFCKLILSNKGLIVDEDVIVTIFIPKGCLSNEKHFTPYNTHTIDFCVDMFSGWFLENKKPNIDLYEETDFDFEINPQTTPYFGINYSLRKSKENIAREKVEVFKDGVKTLYCYEKLIDDTYDILRYRQSQIMHNTNCFFPSPLLFDKIPENIVYEIKSKYMTKVYKGQLIIKKETITLIV